MQWKQVTFVDTVLPFGLRSALKIFSSVADALEWILLRHGMSFSIHYLDDFLTAGHANSEERQHNLQGTLVICKWLGISFKAQKIEGPSCIIISLDML